MKTSPSKVVQAALKNKMNRKFIVRNLIKKYESSLLFAEIRLLLKNHQIRQLRRTQYKDRVKTIEKQGKMKKIITKLPNQIIQRLTRYKLKKFLLLRSKVVPERVYSGIFEKTKKKTTKKTPKHPVIKVEPARPTRQCSLVADPHAQALDGSRFDAQTVGDWVLYQGTHLRVSYSGKSMGKWVGAVKWVTKIDENVIRSVGFNKVLVNGKLISIVKGGKITFKEGSWIKMSGNKVTIGTVGEEVDFYAYGYFFNQYIRSNVDSKKNFRYLCSSIRFFK